MSVNLHSDTVPPLLFFRLLHFVTLNLVYATSYMQLLQVLIYSLI